MSDLARIEIDRDVADAAARRAAEEGLTVTAYISLLLRRSFERVPGEESVLVYDHVQDSGEFRVSIIHDPFEFASRNPFDRNLVAEVDDPGRLPARASIGNDRRAVDLRPVRPLVRARVPRARSARGSPGGVNQDDIARVIAPIAVKEVENGAVNSDAVTNRVDVRLTGRIAPRRAGVSGILLRDSPGSECEAQGKQKEESAPAAWKSGGGPRCPWPL